MSKTHLPYRVILADPPWTFEVWSDSSKAHGSAKAHYDTMTLGELFALAVYELAADDAVLFLWACWPNLLEAIRLGQEWGFTYKTCAFDWIKRNGSNTGWHMGLGYYTRANSEPCLLFTKGTPKRQAMDVRQPIIDDNMLPIMEAVVSPVRNHSQKPDIVHDKIERLFDGPYLELFARKERPGWTCLGNEIDGLDIREALAQLGLFEDA